MQSTYVVGEPEPAACEKRGGEGEPEVSDRLARRGRGRERERRRTDALGARARRHLGGNVERRLLLLDACERKKRRRRTKLGRLRSMRLRGETKRRRTLVLDAEDGEVVHRHLGDVVDVGDAESAARHEREVDVGGGRVTGLRGARAASVHASHGRVTKREKRTHVVCADVARAAAEGKESVGSSPSGTSRSARGRTRRAPTPGRSACGRATSSRRGRRSRT